MATIDIDIGAAQGQLDTALAALTDSTGLMRQIAEVLEAETEHNFDAQGRPSWAPLAKETVKARQKRNKGSSVLKILQDRGILASSISSTFGDDFAEIGAGGAASEYAAIHQFGGTIRRQAETRTIRPRTDAKGNLVRQTGFAKLARFAKDSGKRARESRVEVGEYTINMPARPYLPFRGTPGNAVLQPEAERAVLEVVNKALGIALG